MMAGTPWWLIEDDRPLVEQERIMEAIRMENLVRAKVVVRRDRLAWAAPVRANNDEERLCLQSS